MPYEDDEARRAAARARLQSRMERRGQTDYHSQQTRRTQKPAGRTQPRQPRKAESRETAVAFPQNLFDSVREFIGSFTPLARIIIAAILAVLLIFCITNIVRCSTGSQTAEVQPTDIQDARQVQDTNTSESASIELSIDQAKLRNLIGDEKAAKLTEKAQTNEDAAWIATHLDDFALDGAEVQEKILALAADEELALPYVRNFPSDYPADEPIYDAVGLSSNSPSDSIPDTSVPHLYQWDRRWADTVYSSTTFGLTGCGPTCLAMVYQAKTESNSPTPYDMGVLALERGYMATYEGTGGGFFTDVGSELGLSCYEANPDADTIKSELSSGSIIIANLAPGYFTRYGHYFVLSGLSDDGKVIINDPYSAVRSSQTWDADFIASESRTMFIYA